MTTLNKVILIGRIGANIKLTYYDSKTCVGRFPLATQEVYTDKNNEKVTLTEWHTIVVRNEMAEIFEKKTKKGDWIYVEGRLRSRQLNADNEQLQVVTEIYVTDYRFLNFTQ